MPALRNLVKTSYESARCASSSRTGVAKRYFACGESKDTQLPLYVSYGYVSYGCDSP